jgi:hypothetical protein
MEPRTNSCLINPLSNEVRPIDLTKQVDGHGSPRRDLGDQKVLIFAHDGFINARNRAVDRFVAFRYDAACLGPRYRKHGSLGFSLTKKWAGRAAISNLSEIYDGFRPRSQPSRRAVNRRLTILRRSGPP